MGSRWDKYEGIDFPPPYAPEPFIHDCLTLPLSDQVFTQIRPDGNVVYAVTRIREHCMRTLAPVYLTVLQPAHVRLIMEQRGLEDDRLARAALLTPYYKPLLYLHQPDDGSHLLADGSHTYVARYLLGHRQALAYLVEKEVWRDFLVDGFPTETMSEEELLTSHSRIQL